MHGSSPQGDNRMVWTEMRLTVKGVEAGTDCVKLWFRGLYREGLKEDH